MHDKTIRYRAVSSAPNQFKLVPQRCKTKRLLEERVLWQLRFVDQVLYIRAVALHLLFSAAQ